MNFKELIDSEPANAGRTDQQVLDWANELLTEFQDIQWLDFQKWRHNEGITTTSLQTAANGSGKNATAAQFMLDSVSAGQPFFASDAAVRQLIQDSSLSNPKKASLAALSEVQVPRWRQATDLSRAPILDDVVNARA